MPHVKPEAMSQVLENVREWLAEPRGIRGEIPVIDMDEDVLFMVEVSIRPVGKWSELQRESTARDIEYILRGMG